MKYCTTCHIAYSNDVNSCPTDQSVLSTTSELLHGLIIRGKYQILEKIGSGGMASVYRARHVAFEEIRAIKVVRHWYSEDEDFLRRLKSEAVIARRLKHPNAVQVDDLDQLEDGRPFIVMEYIQGTNLRTLIRDEGPLRCSRALNIARQIASALEAAHALKIIHRDIKPDNIVLVRDAGGNEQVKVLDFGIAKVCGESSKNSYQTRAGVLLCTPEYASPEQARGASAEQLDGRSDLYSLGIVLFEMLTGELPFASDTPMGMLLAQMNTAPRFASDVRPDIGLPVSVAALLEKALQKDCAMRFQTARELIDAIDRVQDADPCATDIALHSPGIPANVAAEPEDRAAALLLLKDLDEPRERGRTLLYTTVILLLLCAVAGGWWWQRVHNSDMRSNAVSVRVQHALSQYPAAARVHATVNNGVIVLSGEVSADSTIDELSSELAGLDGVFEVDRRGVRVVNAVAATEHAAPPASKPVTESAQPLKSAAAVPGSSETGTAAAAVVPSAKETASATLDPRVSDGLAHARAAERKGDYADEMHHYDAVLAVDPNNQNAQRGKQVAFQLEHARMAHDDGAYDDEIEHYEKVLQVDPANAVARKGRAKALRAKQADPGAGVDPQ